MTGVRTCAAALALATALAAAGCGDSPEDTAHSNGKAIGEALRQVTDADSAQQLQDALGSLKSAVADVSDDVGDRARHQASVQRDTINKAIGDVRQAATSTNPDTAAQAKAELQNDVQDLRSQAGSFAHTNDSVANSFWDGVKDGYDD
jgi:ElaB/YqjD/DUF883 family membrane-anchored ribosome-binding protein